MSITRAQRQALERYDPAGPCTRCGAWVDESYRNSAGECGECHNLGNRERRAARTVQRAEQMEKGRQEWAAHGVKPGDQLTYYARSMIGFGGMVVHGTAKVGFAGAYVHVRGEAPLGPSGWRKVAEGNPTASQRRG